MPNNPQLRERKTFSIVQFYFILLVVFPLLLLLGGYFIYTVDRDIRSQTLENWQARQLILVNTAAAGIQATVEHWHHTLKNFASMPAIINMDDEGKNFFRILYEDHPQSISGISRMNRDGILVYTYPESPGAIGRDISQQPHNSKIEEIQKPVLSSLIHVVQGYPAVVYAYPVFKDGIYDGAIGVLIPFDKIAKRFLDPVSLDPQSQLWLLDADNSIIYSSKIPEQVFNNIREVFPANSEALTLFQQKKVEGNSLLHAKYTNPLSENLGETLYAVIENIQLADTHWHFHLATPEERIFEKVKSFRNRWVLVLASFSAVFLAVVIYGIRVYNLHRNQKITEETLEQIAASERKFRLLAENSLNCIYRFDLRSGTYDYVSPAVTTITGYTPEEVMHELDHFPYSIANEASVQKLKDVCTAIQSSPQPKSVEFKITHRDGTPRWLILRGVAIFNAQGEPTHVEGLIAEITQQKEWEKEILLAKESAESANRAKSEFLAMISHELRTPLNPIVGFCDLLISDARDQEQKETLQIVRRSADHLVHIIGDIIDMATLESSDQEKNDETYDLEAFIEQTLAPYRLRAEEKSLVFKTELPTEFPEMVVGSPTRTRQILNHLLSNALKFTTQGEITFTCTLRESLSGDSNRAEKILQFDVIDTGIGIAPEIQEHIFDPFVQGDGSSTRSYEGTGLGLTIARRIASKIKGTLTLVESSPKGSHFRISLPVREAVEHKGMSRR